MNTNASAFGAKKKRHRGNGRTNGYHSFFYHKYFEGWVEYEVLSPNGKKEITRLYTAPWYQMDLGRRRKILWLLGSLLLIGASALCFFYGFIADTSANTKVYVVIPEAVAAVFSGILFITYLSMATAPKQLTIYEYSSTIQAMIRQSKFGCVLDGILVAMVGVDMLCSPQCISGDGKVMLLFLMQGIFLFVLHQISKRIPYIQLSNTDSIPEDAIPI